MFLLGPTANNSGSSDKTEDVEADSFSQCLVASRARSLGLLMKSLRSSLASSQLLEEHKLEQPAGFGVLGEQPKHLLHDFGGLLVIEGRKVEQLESRLIV